MMPISLVSPTKPMKVLSRHLDSMNTADLGETDAVAPETTLEKIEGGKLFSGIQITIQFT